MGFRDGDDRQARKWTWRPKAERAAQNDEILNRTAQGELPSRIARALGLTLNTVKGVISRARNRRTSRIRA